MLKIIIVLLFAGLVTQVKGQYNTVNPNTEKKQVSVFFQERKSETGLKSELKIDTLSIEKDRENLNKSQDSNLKMPLKNLYVTSHYGVRFHPIDNKYKFHRGVDLRAKQDTVYAIYGGEIVDSGYSDSLGNFVKISFNEFITIYGHLSQYFVKAGQIVKGGAKIGITGSTGKSTGEHLHLTIKSPDGEYIDPSLLLEKIIITK